MTKLGKMMSEYKYYAKDMKTMKTDEKGTSSSMSFYVKVKDTDKTVKSGDTFTFVL